MNEKHGFRNPAEQPGADPGRRDLLKLTGTGVAALGAASLIDISSAKAQLGFAPSRGIASERRQALEQRARHFDEVAPSP
jgi:hypothetical protein